MTKEEELESRDVRLVMSVRDPDGKGYISGIFRVGVPIHMTNKEVLDLFVSFIGKRRE